MNDPLDAWDEDDGPRCAWCRKAGAEYGEEGQHFCNEDCADEYWREYGRDL